MPKYENSRQTLINKKEFHRNSFRPSKKPNSCVINESQFNRRTCYGEIPRKGCVPTPYLPQSLAFINALLLNYFARPDFNLTWSGFFLGNFINEYYRLKLVRIQIDHKRGGRPDEKNNYLYIRFYCFMYFS